MGTIASTVEHAPVKRSDGGAQQPAKQAGLSRSFWVRAFIIAALMSLLFWPSLQRLWLKTNPFTGEANWGHAVVIPFISLYYLYINRRQLLSTPVRPILPGQWERRNLVAAGMTAAGGLSMAAIGFSVQSGIGSALLAGGIGLLTWALLALAVGWGAGSLFFGLLFYAYGIWPGQNDYVKDLGIVVTLFGIVLTMCGWRVMRIAYFPIALLICGIPWPELVYSMIASPLQLLAAQVAAFVLKLTGVFAFTTGTNIIFERADGSMRELGVAEACAGLKSLMTFITVSAAVAYLSPRPLWQRLLLVASAVPIAIFCNVMRVAGQGLLDRYVDEQWSRGFAHQFAGLVMMVPAFFLVLLVGWILDNLFIEEADAPAEAASAPMRAPEPRASMTPPPPSVRLAGSHRDRVKEGA